MTIERSPTEARSILAQVVETQILPVERIKNHPRGEVVDLQKTGETIAALQKYDDHYEVSLYDGKGNMTQIVVDPTSAEFPKEGYSRSKPAGTYGDEIYSYLEQIDFPRQEAIKMQGLWYKKVDQAASRMNTHYRGYIENSDARKLNIILPAGDWKMGVDHISWDKESYDTFYFVHESGKGYAIKPKPQIIKTGLTKSGPDSFNPDLIPLSDSMRLRRENTLFKIENASGSELVSYAGTNPIQDPQDPDLLYFISAGQIYRLNLAGVENRSSRPVLERQIQVTDPKELQIEPNGNFLVIRSGGNKLSIIDKETGSVIKSFEDCKGPILVDEHGDIVYIDSQNKIREIQTNFQAISPGGTETAQKKREEELRQMQERFANLELKKNGSGTARISEEDVARTLRENLSTKVSEKITASNDPKEIEDVLDGLQGLKGDPANQAYGEVIDEFITQAREKLSGIRTEQFEGQLTAFQQALDEVKSVGDTIGLDEQLAKLLELRQKTDITDPQKRREIEQRVRLLQNRKDALTTQYQGELVDAVNQAFPQMEQLIKETGSPTELAYFSGSAQAQQFEIMLANVRDPQVRKELRDRFNAARAEQRGKLEEAAKVIEEQDRQRWAQVVEEAREDLASLQEQITQVSDARELDRLGKNPLVTAWRAKLFALPPELREIEEKRLDIILSTRKKDMEHRKELGAVGAQGDLTFGDVSFSSYKEPPRIWQAKLIPREGEFSEWANLVFEDSQGRIFRPDPEHDVVVSTDMSDERTKGVIERYRRKADEYFKGMRREVPDFDENWRITKFHMAKLEEVAEILNLQTANHRGILILEGEAGTGKNVLVDMLANLSNREVVSVLCNENSVKEDLTYEWKFNPQKGTYEVPSRLVEGIQRPGVIVLFDEINALKPGIAKMLNSLFDYRRRLSFPGGDQTRTIQTDPTVLFIGTMNPQNYAGVNRLSPEVKSRSRVVDIEYPPFDKDEDGNPLMKNGRQYWRSDEAEMLAAYMDTLGGLKQGELKDCWDYVINHEKGGAGEMIVQGDPTIESDIRRVYDVIRTANRLREMYQAFQIGDSNEPMDFPTSLREVTDIVMEMNHKKGVKKIVKRVIVPKIDDRRQKKLVEQTIDAVLPGD